MIKLTKTDGTAVWVHPQSVCSVAAGENGTEVQVVQVGLLTVKEAPSSIVASVDKSL